jgi:hypothetical protein
MPQDAFRVMPCTTGATASSASAHVWNADQSRSVPGALGRRVVGRVVGELAELPHAHTAEQVARARQALELEAGEHDIEQPGRVGGGNTFRRRVAFGRVA